MRREGSEGARGPLKGGNDPEETAQQILKNKAVVRLGVGAQRPSEGKKIAFFRYDTEHKNISAGQPILERRKLSAGGSHGQRAEDRNVGFLGPPRGTGGTYPAS